MSRKLERIISIGECMIELAEGEGRIHRGFGGDTLNTAIYLARLLPRDSHSVGYLTALGDDPYSQEMRESWQREGIDLAHVMQIEGRLPGLYAIRTDACGDRSFYYWRDRSAARDLVTHDDGASLRAASSGARLVYLSGITLAILDEPSREILLDAVAVARSAGTLVAFDMNFRPRLWPSLAAAKDWQQRMIRSVDIALPTFDDERALFGDSSPEHTAQRLLRAGVGEVAVKNGERSTVLGIDGRIDLVPPAEVVRAIDTTGAGDSFNAGYLAARLMGRAALQAVIEGQRLASRVVMHRGAIMPREAMNASGCSTTAG